MDENTELKEKNNALKQKIVVLEVQYYEKNKKKYKELGSNYLNII